MRLIYAYILLVSLSPTRIVVRATIALSLKDRNLKINLRLLLLVSLQLRGSTAIIYMCHPDLDTYSGYYPDLDAYSGYFAGVLTTTTPIYPLPSNFASFIGTVSRPIPTVVSCYTGGVQRNAQ